MPSAGHHQELRPRSDSDTALIAEGTRGGSEAAEDVYDYSSLCEHDSSQNGKQDGKGTQCPCQGVVWLA